MKYLIVSIYDSGYGFSVSENGKIITQYNRYGAINRKIIPYLEIFNKPNYEKIFAELPYDLVIICENGGIEEYRK